MSVDGSWNLTMQTPMGNREVKLSLQASGSDLSGTFEGPQGSAPVTGSLNGNNVDFGATINGAMGQMDLKFTGTQDGDSMSGNVAFGAFGSGPWSATRA